MHWYAIEGLAADRHERLLAEAAEQRRLAEVPRQGLLGRGTGARRARRLLPAIPGWRRPLHRRAPLGFLGHQRRTT